MNCNSVIIRRAKTEKKYARPSTPKGRGRWTYPGSASPSTIPDRTNPNGKSEKSHKVKNPNRHPTTVELCGRKHNNPVVSRGIIIDELFEDIAAHRTSSEDRKDFE
jgi:hypothetical protein